MYKTVRNAVVQLPLQSRSGHQPAGGNGQPRVFPLALSPGAQPHARCNCRTMQETPCIVLGRCLLKCAAKRRAISNGLLAKLSYIWIALSCAVVGSSGVLLHGRELGPEIDDHDCIFRINNPPTPEHLHGRVGSMTHFQIVRTCIPGLLARLVVTTRARICNVEPSPLLAVVNLVDKRCGKRSPGTYRNRPCQRDI
eukprot:scaffold246_cov414-Prasinococcus_capsulatus_cf.AAC.23